MLMRVALAFCLGLSATSVAAQDQLAPDTFLDMIVGRTLTFGTIGEGRTVGVEQFLRRDRSVWADKTGRCTYGQIDIRGPYICFIYEDYPDPENCWLPFNDTGRLLVMSKRRGEVQQITDLSDDPVLCEDAPIS
ncbi:hypothetical protein [Sulfitobacter sp. S190]|uniref:hypothetical protein n=1 Tax=Sulfitobacter sp. S190 TaxID=2867022 RepID=UPI0021A70D96|nr:hypothetical protein [Sulfitobacter sp. S190]UWR21419.1 hypothetical protein K3756_11975 [Sulfitobacter sp. S190]